MKQPPSAPAVSQARSFRISHLRDSRHLLTDLLRLPPLQSPFPTNQLKWSFPVWLTSSFFLASIPQSDFSLSSTENQRPHSDTLEPTRSNHFSHPTVTALTPCSSARPPCLLALQSPTDFPYSSCIRLQHWACCSDVSLNLESRAHVLLVIKPTFLTEVKAPVLSSGHTSFFPSSAAFIRCNQNCDVHICSIKCYFLPAAFPLDYQHVQGRNFCLPCSVMNSKNTE